MVEYTAKSKMAAVQAAPVWLDADATIDKSIAMIEEAASNGAELIAFPETQIPGYPWWIWLGSPIWGSKFFGKYHENSLTLDGPRMQRLRDAAKKNRITVVMGYSERGGGSLYMSQVLIGPDGELIGNRRKLKPTHVERAVYGEGDGSDLAVFDLPMGRVGALCCWEHFQPLSKYAMFSQHEQVHIGSWPGHSLYLPHFYSFSPEVQQTAMRMYAIEGQVFVVNSSNMIDQACIDTFCETEEQKALFDYLGGGWARFYGPDGSLLVEPLPHDQEGILYAEIDLSLIPMSKAAADPVGHYSRPDVLGLRFNKQKASPVDLVGDMAPPIPGVPSKPAEAEAEEAPTDDAPRHLREAK